jgi:general secretion pathway protein E
LAAAGETSLPINIPYGFAKRFGVALLGEGDGRLLVAMREGADPRALIEVRRYLARSFDVQFTDPPQFDRILSERYAMDGQAAADAAGSLGLGDELSSLASDLPTAEDLLDSADDAPAIRLINGIIADAARQGVSDIHIEPYETGLIVRMRVDGVLRETLRMPPHVAPVVVSRIKVMAGSTSPSAACRRTAASASPSAASCSTSASRRLPSRAGERVVLRILDKENAGLDLEVLGMPPAILQVYREALAEPNGIVLVTGPTGSGKTTSLYSGLRLLNDGSSNILTVEDPVEYAMDGVGQTQVNDKVGLSFATGLRAILRRIRTW